MFRLFLLSPSLSFEHTKPVWLCAGPLASYYDRGNTTADTRTTKGKGRGGRGGRLLTAYCLSPPIYHRLHTPTNNYRRSPAYSLSPRLHPANSLSPTTYNCERKQLQQTNPRVHWALSTMKIMIDDSGVGRFLQAATASSCMLDLSGCPLLPRPTSACSCSGCGLCPRKLAQVLRRLLERRASGM